MDSLRKITGVCLSGAAALAVAGALLLTGCRKDSTSWWGGTPREVEVTLAALSVADAVVVEPMGSRSVAGVADDDGLFTVSLGPGDGDAPAGRSLSTRADVALNNVWVLQFDAAGVTKTCAYVGTVAAGQRVKTTLLSGEDYTVWIVANGPAEGGLTTSNPASLSDFENKLLYTATPSSDEQIPLSGKLTGVRILDNGQVLVGGDNTVVPEVTLTRAMARVDVLLEYDVSGAELDGVWLYQVPAGACYGLADGATDYPASTVVSNFAYRNGDSEGLAPASSGSGTVTHTWYIGDNRRGENAAILWEKNKGAKNAPAMSTYARIKSHESADASKGLYHDVYLGDNVTTDFNVRRNRHYIYRVRIGGTLEAQKLLAERDDRVWAGMLEYLDGAPTVEPSLDQIIAINGQTFKVKFKGYWTGSGILVRACVGNEVLASNTALWQTGDTGEVSLVIPKNGGEKRQILFEYQWKGEWIPIGVGTQAGVGITGATVAPEGDIPAGGGDYSITLNGGLPEGGVEVRVIADDGKSLVSGLVLRADEKVAMTVPANTTGAARTVVFEYKWNGEWVTIEERSQAAQPTSAAVGELYGGGVVYWVNPDDAADFRVVALDQASSTMTWSARDSYVLGSDAQDQTARNGADVWKIAKAYSDNKTGGASGVFATDFPAFGYCYNKTDGADGQTVPKGTWYLPSKQELLDLYDAKGSVGSVITANKGTAFSAGNYWSATESSSSSSYAWYVDFSTGYTSTNNKTLRNSVRCVRGK